MTEAKKQKKALTAQKAADAAGLASNTASATADAMLAVEKDAADAFDTAIAAANAAKINLAMKDYELDIANDALIAGKLRVADEYYYCSSHCFHPNH